MPAHLQDELPGGEKNEAIAGELSISYNTVRTQKLRALKLIRAGLLKRNLLPVFYAWLAFTGHGN